MATKAAPHSASADFAEKLLRLGLRREQDLLLHLPLRYEDETRVVPVARLRDGEFAQVEGEVLRHEVTGRKRTLVVDLRDDTGTVSLRFFNYYGSQLRQFVPGARVRALGEVRAGLFGLEISHPRYRLVREGTPLPDRLTPVYPTAAGIAQVPLRAAILRAVRTAAWPPTIPVRALGPDLQTVSADWPEVLTALRTLHEPRPGQAVEELEDRSHPAWQRLIFEELVAQQLSLRRARVERAQQQAHALAGRDRVEQLRGVLPFRLTGAQERAWAQVSADLGDTQPMNRLLQGDVGSGKTVIAALAAAQCVGSGLQAALMAPTEILAEQHFRKLSPWMEAIGVRVDWLASSVKGAAKRKVRDRLAAGEIDLLVGTHALIEDAVGFGKLGLAIVDEQHRFGVGQRLALRGKGDQLPHQLMMSATPIPRTLAMTYYADLDVSVIDELPPGRKPITTRLIPESRREELVERVRAAAQEGRQVYWVCPLIEESEALELQTALETHEALAQALAPLAVGLVHGRLPTADKQQVMDAFVRGELQVLVATTVIEVGVDVPNASLMVIEHAERFGLAQLHQLRGRVGRGPAESACVLMYRGPLSALARERLKVMHDTQDGFEIARRDLQLRGPGEFLGARQSGVPLLRFADLERDAWLVEQARDCALRLLETDPEAADRHLARWLGGREEFLRA